MYLQIIKQSQFIWIIILTTISLFVVSLLISSVMFILRKLQGKKETPDDEDGEFSEPNKELIPTDLINTSVDIEEHKVLGKFLKYVKVDTRSSRQSQTCPTTKGQMVLAKMIRRELKQLGLSDIILTDNGYLFATLSSNLPDEEGEVDTIGFVCHMDTYDGVSGKVNPKILRNYQGGDVVLNKDKNILLKETSKLLKYMGHDIITTSGDSLLGGDDKAGIAEIMAAVEYIVENKVPHGNIKLAFVPDEEIGRSINNMDLQYFDCDFAFTLDGGSVGKFSFENFNAANVLITVKGKDSHPGSDAEGIINSLLVTMKIMERIPKSEMPWNTSGRNGFIHIVSNTGNVSEAKLKIILRYFSSSELVEKKNFLYNLCQEISKEENCTIDFSFKRSYKNMKEKVWEKKEKLVDTPLRVMRKVGITPKIVPFRGGTDGARLSFKGVPCPNIFSGAENKHSIFEFVSVQSLRNTSIFVVNLIEEYASSNKDENLVTSRRPFSKKKKNDF